MAKRARKRDAQSQHRRPKPPRHREAAPAAGLRIIGGLLRGRKLLYSGDPRTRPMKDRLRETVFNLLGPAVRGKHAIDLFAGTGALGLEALSRGAQRATLVERHHPTAEIIRQNIAVLDLDQRTEVLPANVFIWWKKIVQTALDAPWIVFCSPPYDFFVDRAEEMLGLVTGLIRSAPRESIFVVEADARFDFQTLPDPQAWDVRSYPPAVVGIYRISLDFPVPKSRS